MLTYHQDDEVELFSHLRSFAEEATKNLLALGQLTTTNVIGTVKRHDTVDDEETVFIGGEILCKAFELFGLHLLMVGKCDTLLDGALTSLF